jgi:hypothetical protein
VLAALPTGLLSQRFAAQEPPIDARGPREESIIVASEIETASGTPDPRPYAHAEIPAVVVSNTQLSGPTPKASGPGAPLPAAHEPPPIVVLPNAFRSTARRKVIALGAAACALAALMSFVIVRQRAQGNRSPVPDAARGTDDGSAGPDRTADRAPTAGRTSPDEPARGASPHAVVARATAATDADAHAAAAAADSAHPAPQRDTSRPPQKPSEAPVSAVKKTGELAVLVKPWALLWLNGKPMNQTPYRDTIPAGRYHLRLKNDDLGKDESIVVTVTPDHTTIIERKW